MFLSVLGIMVLWMAARVYAIIFPVYEDDPELYVVWKRPKDDEFLRKTDGAKYVGNLFAGRAEFPFLVDVRSENNDPEGSWAIGNLIDSWHVLTSCRAIKEYKAIPAIYPNNTEYTTVSTRYRSSIKVNFAPTYLWENHPRAFRRKQYPAVWTDQATFYLESGTRLAKHVHFHKDCGKALSWDIAIIHLSEPIKPLIPVIQYMKLFWRRVSVTGDAQSTSSLVVQDFNLTEQADERRVCFVASYGRGWRNWPDNIVVDYKVKYRAYFEKMDTCYVAARLFQLEDDQDIDKSLPKYPLDYYNPTPPTNKTVDSNNTYCMVTRARVGTVCDHDRGAPVVCDGFVSGFVVRGAQWQYCNNLISMPFVVVRSTVMHAYYTHAVAALSSFGQRGWRLTGYSRSIRLFHRYVYLYTLSFSLLMKNVSP